MLFSFSAISIASFLVLAQAAPTSHPASKCTVTQALLDPSTYRVDQQTMSNYYADIVNSITTNAVSSSSSGGTPKLSGHIYVQAQPVVEWPVHAGHGPVILPVKIDIAYEAEIPKNAVQSPTLLNSLKKEVQELLDTVVTSGHFYSLIQAECELVSGDDEKSTIQIKTSPLDQL